MARKGQRSARQVRRVVRPKGLPATALSQPGPPQDQKKQRQRYIQSGGLLQGYAPEFVLGVAYRAALASLGCALVAVVILLLLPRGWAVRGVAAAAWLVPIIFAASFIVPAWRLARKDRREEPRLIRGQLVGASPVSTSFGLGMLMLQTRSGVDQYLVPPERLTRVPGNQVGVVVTITPHLRHVRSVVVSGPRMASRPEPQVPDVLKRLRWLPIMAPAALSAGVIIGADAVALAPIGVDAVHAALALVGALVLAGAIYGLSLLMQRRLYAQAQALLPGGL
jgi:hypothetical protein